MKKSTQTIDWTLYLLVIILTVFGILVIYSISYSGTGVNFFKGQIIFAIIGLILMVVFSLIDYRYFKEISVYLYVVGILLLIAVLIFGKVAYGASRWIDLYVFQLQPSEVFKFVLIISLATYLSNNKSDFGIRQFITCLFMIILPIILVLLQPDFGTALVLLVIGIGMLIAARIKAIYLWFLGILGATAIPLTYLFLLKGYQKNRIITFLNPQADPFGKGYSVLQSIIAVGSGMFNGQGFGQGLQSNLKFLPVSHTDFIFAVFAEEFGFIGCIILIILFGILVVKILRIAKIAADDFGMLICCGFVILLLFQILVNIGMNIGIMPVTGIPLPFISYGGTSLIIILVLMGILQSIVIRHKKLAFD
jgi:rod shape determining protein RodA